MAVRNLMSVARASQRAAHLIDSTEPEDRNGRWIGNFEGRYRLTDDGVATSYLRSDKGEVLCPRPNTFGALQFTLYASNGRLHYPLARRLVYETYIGEIPEGYEVFNKNGDQTDNRVANLGLRTPAERMAATWRRRKASA